MQTLKNRLVAASGMRIKSRIAAALLGLVGLSAVASAAVIGGTYYATQYDYREFFAATDGRNFQVILAGNPFPGVDPNIVARDLLPIMQAAKPRPALTFTYDSPVERPRPDYRLVLIFDPALDLGSTAGVQWRNPLSAGQAGRLLCLRRLLPQRPGDVRDDRLDGGERAQRPAHRPAVPRAVPGRVQRLAGTQAAKWRLRSALALCSG